MRTERLWSRLMTEDDLGWLWHLDGDPEVLRFITGGQRPPWSAYERVIRPRFLGAADGRPEVGFHVVHRGAQVVGWAHLRVDEHLPDALEVGYRLRRAAWGQGVATEICGALVTYAFEHLAAPRVTARTLPDNVASQRVLTKCGLRRTGELRFEASTALGMPMPAMTGWVFERTAGPSVG